MVKCYYCGKYKSEDKVRKIVVGRGKKITGRKDGIDYVYTCGCYDKDVTRPTIDYLKDGKIITEKTTHQKTLENNKKDGKERNLSIPKK